MLFELIDASMYKGRRAVSLQAAWHGSNLRFPGTAQASAALGFPLRISLRMHLYRMAAVCSSVRQHQHANLHTNTWWEKSLAPGNLSAYMAEGKECSWTWLCSLK